ncbi:MAG: DNA polymerase/3'-5' exonuclease PolX [Candidatus Pacebacteria bacterium]|nr:DNA polymerase/3'-5' exonuclease PolX [Candidatus Paceibacterota bacterium]
MNNQELAKVFYEISDYLEMDKVAFKPYAYQKAAIALESMEEDVEDIYRRGGIKDLEEIPGVGKSIAEKIEEYLKTGKIQYYQQFKKRLPLDLEEIIAVEGMGPKRAKLLYQKLGVRNVKELEKAAKAHKIAALEGFGEKTEKNLLEGIAFLKRSKGRFLLGEILPKVKEILDKLKALKEVEQISEAGSVRRRKETIGDVDILITAKNLHPVRKKSSNGAKKVMDFFVQLPNITKIWGKGTTKSSIRLREGFDVDLRVVSKKSFGSALQYFTGSKEHNIVLRRIAIKKGMKLNEYGLFKGKKMIAGWYENGVYKALGLSWIEPELREDQGELEAARNGELPKIIGYKDIKGDLHCHSAWDGGTNTIEVMAKAAQDMGYQYIGIADHTKFLRIENGLDEKELEQQRKEIDKLNEKLAPYRTKGSDAGFHILQGCEANILSDGSIDIKDKALEKLDFVIAGIHSAFKMEKSKMTERMIKAMRNPNVDIISHPTGRILKKRDEYQIDFDKILKVAKETKTILEINAWPERLDLNEKNIKKAKEAGVKMVINTDSHDKNHMRFMNFGIAQARRGWAEKSDIINSQPLAKLLQYFK